MFCPSCGTEYTIELHYCNRCGANLSSPVAEPPQTISVNLNKAVAVIGTTLAVLTIGGFIALIVGAVELSKSTGMRSDPIIAMIMMGMLTILTADVFLVRQLSKLISAALSSHKPQQLKRPPASAMLGMPSIAELPKPITARLEPAPSVTENTTRFFEPAYRAPSDPEEPVS
jgi:hypothetical protein